MRSGGFVISRFVVWSDVLFTGQLCWLYVEVRMGCLMGCGRGEAFGLDFVLWFSSRVTWIAGLGGPTGALGLGFWAFGVW